MAEDLTSTGTTDSSLPAKFFLKTAAHPWYPNSPYIGLYLRHHGSGIDSVVLTETQPKYIKAHIDDDRQITFTSVMHPGRWWGLKMCVEGLQRAGWEKVEIVEDYDSKDLVFDLAYDEVETLSYRPHDEDGRRFTGWMVCEWATGHPQLFWCTDVQSEKPLPSFCHRVRIVREML